MTAEQFLIALLILAACIQAYAHRTLAASVARLRAEIPDAAGGSSGGARYGDEAWRDEPELD